MPGHTLQGSDPSSEGSLRIITPAPDQFTQEIRDCSIITEWSAGSGEVQGGGRLSAAWGLGVALHIECDPLDDMLVGSDPIHALLHFAVAAIASLNGIGGGRQE